MPAATWATDTDLRLSVARFAIRSTRPATRARRRPCRALHDAVDVREHHDSTYQCVLRHDSPHGLITPVEPLRRVEQPSDAGSVDVAGVADVDHERVNVVQLAQQRGPQGGATLKRLMSPERCTTSAELDRLQLTTLAV